MHTDRPSTLPFEKWHGTGNDFILCSRRLATGFTADLNRLARDMCDRHFGVGSDGLILIGASKKADFHMRMWNPDGSESEMCGNGLRCVAAQILANGLVYQYGSVDIETTTRIVKLDFPNRPDCADPDLPWVRVALGKPVMERSEIPITGDGPSPVIKEKLEIPGCGVTIEYTAVNFGNPHAVIFVEDVDSVPLEQWGPALENFTDLFPSRVNSEFVQVLSNDHVRMRVWERGAGITLSCGSGTAAVQVACHLTGLAGDTLRVDVPGGSLLTEYNENGEVHLSGPAVRVFKGEWL